MTIWTVEVKNDHTKGKWKFHTACTTQDEARSIAEHKHHVGHWRIRKFIYAGAACHIVRLRGNYVH